MKCSIQLSNSKCDKKLINGKLQSSYKADNEKIWVYLSYNESL